MSLAHQSIATINSPEFINLQPLDINPLMSSCEIKVLYLGANRNGSYITKDVAQEMAKSLRGAPIVGYYKKDKQDFADHGQQLILDDQGIHFNVLTKPYGFVSPNAKVWFQDFEDGDDFGNHVVRTYLMTTGYLWTGQFEQAKQALENGGRPQSMELDEKSLKGKWSRDIKEDIEFFIINDAIFSKLCILGDDVEPCFEGSAITPPQVSTSFGLDDDFKHTLFEMMQQLTYALEGGKKVAEINKDEVLEVNEEVTTEEVAENFELEQDKSVESSLEENNIATETSESTFEKKDDQEEEKSDDSEKDEDKEDDSQSNQDDEEEKKKNKYTILQAQYSQLQSDYSALESEVVELRQFKTEIENQQKDELIAQFYMLSDEDKKDVIENKSKYSLEEIESKLAVICFKKKVNFNLETSQKNDDTMTETESTPVTTFNVGLEEDSTPDWVKAVESTMNSKD